MQQRVSEMYMSRAQSEDFSDGPPDGQASNGSRMVLREFFHHDRHGFFRTAVLIVDPCQIL